MQQEKLLDLVTIVILLCAIIFLPLPKPRLANSPRYIHKNNTVTSKAGNVYVDNLYSEAEIIPCAMLKF